MGGSPIPVPNVWGTIGPMVTAISAPSLAGRLLSPELLATHPIYGRRPLLRGRLHQAAAVASIPAGAGVVLNAGPDTRAAAAAYAVTCTLMFTTSAAYHRLAQSVGARFWMRRLDHSMIMVHIAGGTTPVALNGIGGRWGQGLLALSWTVAVTGVALKLVGLTDHRDPGAWAFPVLGWLPLLGLPELAERTGPITAALLLATIAVYTIGAVCFHRKRPDPLPEVFGYHEVWHAFTLVAAGLQLVLTQVIVTA